MKNILAWLAKVKASPATAQQGVHFLVGYSVLLTAAYFDWNMYWAAFSVLAFAVLIETVFDPAEEHDPFWPNGAEDCAFYFLGTALGFIVGR